MKLTVRLGNGDDLSWARKTVEYFHYLKSAPHPQTRSMVYVVEYAPTGTPRRLGLCMAGIPHATKRKGWWGMSGLITQWQVLDLNRIWLDPLIQSGGTYCQPEVVPGFTDRRGQWQPAVASWLIGQVLSQIQVDRISLWPPVFPDQPYHIRLVISYHDPEFHRGTIYRMSGAQVMDIDSDGNPIPGPSGKYGWYWRLPQPDWEWRDIKIMQPRTMRLPLVFAPPPEID